MTIYFITRHEGARRWAEEEGFAVERMVDHLDPADIRAGDAVLGTLPVNLAAEVCARGGRYFHLSLNLPPEWRGRELTPEDMRRFGQARGVPGNWPWPRTVNRRAGPIVTPIFSVERRRFIIDQIGILSVAMGATWFIGLVLAFIKRDVLKRWLFAIISPRRRRSDDR